jgi:hypothetical protein
MAKKLKRVAGVSNKKVTSAPSGKPAQKKSRAAAGAGSGPKASMAEARDPRVEKRRQKAARAAAPSKKAQKVGAIEKPPRKKALAVAPGEPKAARKAARKEEKRAGGEKVRKLRFAVGPRTVIVLILLVVFVALSASPVARNIEATSKLKAMARELASQKKTTKSLEYEVGQARSLEYIEQEARRQRMVGPGEVLYLVTTDTEGPKVEYRLKALQSMDEAWERVRQMLHCAAPRQASEQ